MWKPRIISLLMSFALLAASLPVWAETFGGGPSATRGEVADMLLQAADDYTPGLTRGDIMKGYGDGTIRDNEFITRAESFVMVSRAFGPLPAPIGNNARLYPVGISFAGVPLWAQADVDNLTAAGILVGTPDGELAADENVTARQVQYMIDRIYVLLGSNVRDDFYSTINKTLLDTSVIPPGEMASGAFNDLMTLNQNRLTEIIEELASGDYEKGSKEQKIADFYLSAADMQGRNREGLAPIQKYLDAIDAAKNISELFGVQSQIRKEMGCDCLLSFAMSNDAKDSTKYSMYLQTLTPAMTKQLYAEPIGPKQQSYLDYLAAMLVISGATEAQAKEEAAQFYELEKALAKSQLDRQEYADVEKTYNIFTPEQLDELFAGVNVEDIITESGMRVPDEIIVQDVGLTKRLSEFINEDNLPLLKICVKIGVLNRMGGTLDSRFEEASNKWQKEFLGVEGEKSPQEYASLMTQNIMGMYLGQIYAERYFPAEAKQDVLGMVHEFIGIFKQRLEQLDWMSETTKQMAAKKLDTMSVKIGYPDKWDTPLDSTEIIGPSTAGNSFFENVCAVLRATRADNAKKQDQSANRDEWLLATYTVNAYYNASANEIVFPAGILQAPFYDLNANREENLGGIGAVIAHEITHAFDNNGAKYDENGNAANWWTEQDYTNFQELCADVIDYYDGYEAAPGILTNGTLTLSENIADLGGLACALDAMTQMKNPDYRAFFENYARIWAQTTTRGYLEYLNQIDYHSFSRVRANRTAAVYQEFYDTFDVTEGDGMFVAPEKRIRIW